MKTAAIALLVLALLAATARSWLGIGGAEQEQISANARAKVTRGPLRITIEQDGFLSAKQNVSIKPKFKGQGTITWLVDEGKSVQPGDLLIEYDKTQIENQVSELENSLIQFELEREAAETNLEIQKRDNAAAVEKSELALTMAELALERYEKGDAPNELRKLELALEKAQSELERAKERFEQVPELVRQGFLTRIQEEEERIRLREAEINAESAKLELSLHDAYTRKIEGTKKEADVKDARRELANATEKAEINLKEKQAALAQRERQVNSTKTRLEQQRTELGHYTVKAEIAGTVHYGDPEQSWWRENIKVGSVLYQGQTVITIPDLSEMQLIVQVHEADIEKVALEMPVNVTVDSRRGESFQGRIIEIASVASSTNWSDEKNKSFKVKIALGSTPGSLRAGVTAKAEIQVETLEDVLQAPVHAVVPEGGKHFAFVIGPSGPEKREVEIGKHNAHFVQVLKGLSEGEELLLYDPRTEGAAGSAGDAGRAEPGASTPAESTAGSGSAELP